MNRYEDALKALVWFAREYDGKPEQVELLTVACKKAQAFDIVVRKKVDIGILNCTIICQRYNEIYNAMLGPDQLTKEEYDLLKEVLIYV